MDGFYEFFRQLWVVWLMLLFIGIVTWAYWPTKKRKRDMRDHADIPFRDRSGKGSE